MATWTTPKTWVAASALTASELNEQVRDNLTYLYDRDVGTNLTLSSDVTTSSASWANLTGMSFACAVGKNYSGIGVFTWKNNSGGGLAIGFDKQSSLACNIRMFIIYSGEASANDQSAEHVTAVDTGTGVATVDTNDAARFIRFWLRVTDVTVAGTLMMRTSRVTGGTSTVQAGSSIFITHD